MTPLSLSPADLVMLWERLCEQDTDERRPLQGSSAEIFGPLRRATYYDTSPEIPNHGVYYYEDSVVVLSAGLKSAVMGLQFVQSWFSRSEMADNDGFMAIVSRWARQIYNRALKTKLYHRDHVILVGHSGGCPTMEALAHEIYLRGHANLMTILTGGGPRCILSGFEDNLPRVARWRFMMSGDPVTYLPPHADESPGSWLVAAHATIPLTLYDPVSIRDLGTGQAPGVWEDVRHAPGGIQLTPEGNSWYATDPPIAANALGDIVNWLAFQDIRHAKTYQLAAMRLWLERNSPQPDTQAGEGGGGAWGIALDITPEETNSRIPGELGPTTDSNFNYVLPITPTFERFPMDTVPIQTNSKPRPGGGRLYALTLGGLEIAVYSSSGRARTAARHLRAFLFNLNQAQLVDQQGVSDGLSAFLAAASVGKGLVRRSVAVV